MLPLIDVANHSFEPTATVRPAFGDGVARGAVELAARREIAAGDPVTLDYGALTNDHFLLDYGFVPTTESGNGNPHDVAASVGPRVTRRGEGSGGARGRAVRSRAAVGGGGDVVAGRAVRAVAGGRASSIGPGGPPGTTRPELLVTRDARSPLDPRAFAGAADTLRAIP